MPVLYLWLHLSKANVVQNVYGIVLDPVAKADIVELGHHTVDAINRSAMPGTFLVDVIPIRDYQASYFRPPTYLMIVKYWPSWAYGGNFQKKAAHWRKAIDDFKVIPFKKTLESAVRELCVLCSSI